MSQSKWFLHPILIFISSIAAVALSLILYIYWYVEVSTGLKKVIEKANLDPDQVLASQTWVVILVLSILVGIILMGIFIIFVYNQKTFQLYRLQRNFINNFTHELKTPVTSLKLYLETFRKYELSREDQLKYIGYMVQDADRLSDNINRILNLAKIESKTYGEKFVREDLVQVVEQFYEKNRHLFEGCEINIHNPSGRSFSYPISPALFEMLLMNLFTNAIKYNESEAPRLDITFEPKETGTCTSVSRTTASDFQGRKSRRFSRSFTRSAARTICRPKAPGSACIWLRASPGFTREKLIAESKGGGKGSVFSLILPFKTFGA